MNHLEHLRALRDKALVQTEQAKAVLRQQTEITESLDRLIADLESRQKEAITAFPDKTVASPLETQSVYHREDDEKKLSTPRLIDEVIWQNKPISVPPVMKKVSSRPFPPFSPVVWEVVETAPLLSATVAPALSSVDQPAAEPTQLSQKFEFLKLSPEPLTQTHETGVEEIFPAYPDPDSVALSDDTISIPAPAPGSLAAAAGLRAVSVKLNPEPSPALMSPVPQVPPVTPASNVFFDANSAYLKECELIKLKTIAESVKASGQSRIIKIQGLEDLASSNDFKELLASRRLIAVKKKLIEQRLVAEQVETRAIRLSEEGRILQPASIAVSADGF